MDFLRKVRGARVIALLGFLSFFLPANSAIACDCREPESVFESLDRADVVFFGTVTNLRYLDNPEQMSPEPRTVVTFRVRKMWKGTPAYNFVLHTNHNYWSCEGFAFVQGKRYLVFAKMRDSGDEGFWSRAAGKGRDLYGIKACSGTKVFLHAKQDILELERRFNETERLEQESSRGEEE